MNVIIFGANGKIGQWALKCALRNGHSVTAYVRNASKMTEKNERLTVIEGNINDAAACNMDC